MSLMRTPEGVVVDVPVDQAAAAREAGYQPVTPTEAAPAVTRPESNDSALLAGITAPLSGATLGLSDAAIAALGTQGDVRAVREARAAHPILSGAGEFAGAIAPAFLTGGESLPVSLATRTGAGVTEAAGGGLLAHVVGGGAEGAIFGAGQGVSDLALSQDPLTVERIGSTLSSDMLYGAGAGAGIAGAGALIGRGLRSAKGAIDGYLEQRAAAKALVDTPGAIGTADVATLDRAGLAKAETAELTRLETERLPDRQKFATDLGEFYNDMAEQKLSKTVTGVADAEARRAGAALKGADRDLMRLTDNEVGLTAKPERALNALQTQRQALGDMESWLDEERGQFWNKVNVARVEIRQDLAVGKLEGYAKASELTPAGRDLAVNQELARRFKMTIDASGMLEAPANLSIERLEQIEKAIERNKTLTEQLGRIATDPTSDRLTAIAQAREALGVPQPKSLGGQALHVAARFAGPIGAIAETGASLFGGIRKAAGAAAERSGKAASAFLAAAAKATDRAGSATPLATKVLADLRYSADRKRKQQDDESPTDQLPALYKQRTDEIKQLTEYDATGMPKMRADAREQLAAKLQPIGVHDPLLADRLESYAARRISYISSILPRRPDIAGVQVGPDRWQPSDMEMRSLARSMAAVEDPHAVLERALHGQVSPEDVKAMNAVHPEILKDYVDRVAAALPTLRATLPYHRRLSLSLLTGQPVDPALDPHVLAVLQGQFPAEPGSAGGTQAPRAQPQFGSMAKLAHDSRTPAQERKAR